ncbi:MAG TPA: GH3 auxin-responsive promoter family protein [Ferruginibacter sp.]|nr:GH3 auxin-responsive promoter family protein [Bacteroidota bacterium]HMT96274.1 GH3 auxin-responsive promoter family protein [Ferruginibacter sp.]HMU23500.1 GH3 auxin-responsive promoter family protein [Ferruginibacter sp.]HRD44356.1 GH3 auxin-responsive promoter family protein [Ferruginibacter sp.]
MALFEMKLPASIARALNIPVSDVRSQQLKVLKKLLRKARFTEFGQQYRFDEILLARHCGKKFQQEVPTYNYSKIYKEWWYKTLEGIPDVCWPGVIKYFALSSGTSEASSKYIPITKELVRSNTITSIKQLMSLARYEDVPKSAIGKGWLMLGGSTQLQKGPTYYAGDLSGIQQKNIPFWFMGLGLYKPGKKIAKEKDWSKKLDEVVENAPNWDIGFIVGVPAWLQLCLEKIIERYRLKNIHELWPNLSFYVHGGVALEPYKRGFEKLLGKPITYIETYLASEGFLAYQNKQGAKGMHLALNNNIFFEFVPFDDKNFDGEGNMVDAPETLMLHEIEEHKEYAILITTNAGAWRYAIGDTVKLIDKKASQIIITGRTKHFLSLVGEHLSVDNMNKAIEMVSEQMNVFIPEFTVAGVPYGNFFAHEWFLASDDKADEQTLAEKIDANLKQLNDDYEVERNHALKNISVKLLPEKAFMDFMEARGKIGGQHKFPRVLKGKILNEWQDFVATYTKPENNYPVIK